MAPDRGETAPMLPGRDQASSSRRLDQSLNDAEEPRHFTVRGILVGLVIGTIICFSNMYFGLQTGWISSMAMPSALLGFSYFKLVSRWISYPFTPVENVF